MQIMPNSGGWTSAAASAQHSLNDTKHSSHAAPKGIAPRDAVDRLEESGKITDRDANERYDGQQPQNDAPSNSEADSSKSNNESLLNLPAIDEATPPILDLMG
ncbi:MAG: hypothetical protein ABL921_19235 [Pirellula sp.]